MGVAGTAAGGTVAHKQTAAVGQDREGCCRHPGMLHPRIAEGGTAALGTRRCH